MIRHGTGNEQGAPDIGPASLSHRSTASHHIKPAYSYRYRMTSRWIKLDGCGAVALAMMTRMTISTVMPTEM